jgi:hypothetical protein
MGVSEEPESDVRWPIRSMLLVGTFGASQSEAGRRYHSRVWSAFAVAVGVTLLLRAVAGDQGFRWLTGVILGPLFGYIAYELWRYISALDELARRLQLEALAIVYLIGLAIVLTVAGIGNVMPFSINPLLFLALEPIRGLVLVLRSRQYR